MNRKIWRGLVLASVAFATLAVSRPALAQYSEEVEASATAETQVPLPYRGSIAIYEHNTRPWAYSGEELTYNPQYVHSLSLRPRWYFTDQIWARVVLDMEQELTNSDDSTTRNEFRVAGTTLDINYTGIPLVTNLTFTPKVTFGFPTDQVSQIRTMYLSIGPGLALDYKIPGAFKGLTLTLSGSFTKYLNRFADGDADVIRYCGSAHSNETVECSTTGTMNPNFRLLWGAVAALQVTDELSVSGDFRIYNSWAYDVPDSSTTTLTGESIVDHSDDDTRLRALNRFIFDVSYNVTKYFAVSIGTDTYSTQLNDDATYRNPFYNRYTNFYLDLTLTADELVRALTPSAATAQGRQRTRTAANETAPRQE